MWELWPRMKAVFKQVTTAVSSVVSSQSVPNDASPLSQESLETAFLEQLRRAAAVDRGWRCAGMRGSAGSRATARERRL